MKYLRFYYFSFLYFYKDKPESWNAEYRSMFIVSYTVISLMSFVLLVFYPNFKGVYTYARFSIVAIFIILCAVIQRALISNGKYRLIFEEFKSHPINTKSNRIACWIIWSTSFIAPMVLAILQKIYVK